MDEGDGAGIVDAYLAGGFKVGGLPLVDMEDAWRQDAASEVPHRAKRNSRSRPNRVLRNRSGRSRTRDRANVCSGGGLRPAKMGPPHGERGERPEAWHPWYGSSMKAQHRTQIDGGTVRRRARPTARADDGLYRYVPVPPVGRDEDGYLFEDGMGQNYTHQRQTSFWCNALRRRLPTATVCSDLFLHYRQGDRNGALVPDLFVALRAPPREGRLSYKLWEDPLPELVVEMLSGSTAGKDVDSKRRTCEHLGVREYWLFDPKGHRLPAPLAGHRLRAGRYRPIAADAGGRMRSEVLGLDLHVLAGELRFWDPATGEDLRTYDEAEDRADVERGRADTEKDRADAAEGRADAEKNRADAAEREVARLRLRLGES